MPWACGVRARGVRARGVPQMLASERPLSVAAAQELAYLEGQLAARAGVCAAIVRAASAW